MRRYRRSLCALTGFLVFGAHLGLAGAVSSSANAELKKYFAQVMTKPSKQALVKFSKACTPKAALSFESSSANESAELAKLANLGLETADLIPIRALIKALGCSGQGASTEWVASFLGNEVLTLRPALLIKAIKLERQEQQLADISNHQNAQWFAIQCQAEDRRCQDELKAYWDAKVKALQEAKVDKKDEDLRQKLLFAIEKTRAK